MLWEKFEDTKGVIGHRKLSKDTQYNEQNKKEQKEKEWST
jgi:hypothetical protein